MSIFPYFLCLKLFDDSWGHSYIRLLIIDIKFRFTCGECNMYLNFVKFLVIMLSIVGLNIIISNFLAFKETLFFLVILKQALNHFYLFVKLFELLFTTKRFVSSAKWWSELYWVARWISMMKKIKTRGPIVDLFGSTYFYCLMLDW